jgi:hypothetical protein
MIFPERPRNARHVKPSILLLAIGLTLATGCRSDVEPEPDTGPDIDASTDADAMHGDDISTADVAPSPDVVHEPPDVSDASEGDPDAHEDVQIPEPPGELPTIDTVAPIDGVHVGQIMTLRGSNFDFPPTNNTIEVDGVEVSELRWSSDAFLRFIVPASIDIAGPHRDATVSVTGRNGTTSEAVRLLPPLSATGQAPRVTSVVTGTGSPNLIVGQSAIVNGENFGTEPALVDVALWNATVTSASPVLVQSVTNTAITFLVPDTSPIRVPGSDTYLVVVTVGSHVPAERVVSVD